jgi:hypothetical protein
MVLNDDAALAILSPMRTAAPPTVPDATALIELLQVLPRMPSICDTLADCVALADRFSTAPLLPQQLRIACGGSSVRIKFASMRVLAPNAPPQCAPVAVAPAAPPSPPVAPSPSPVAAAAPAPQPQPSPQLVPPPVDATTPPPSTSIASVTSISTDLYVHVFGAELASACGETLRAARVDRDVLTALAGFEQSECVSMLTKSVGVSAGHAILMARALSRWQH